MKKFLFPIIIIATVSLAFIPADNPLRNTKWSGANGIALQFTASDTVKLLLNNQVLSSSIYKVKDSLLTWKDYVKSPTTCDTSIKGTYIYKIKEDILKFTVISDRCEDRANVIQTLVLIKE
jgi:hypothetical protein